MSALPQSSVSLGFARRRLRAALASMAGGLLRACVAASSRSVLTRSVLTRSVLTRNALLRGALCASVAGSACSSNHFDGQVFRKGDVAFRLERLPPTWRHLEISDTALAFRDDENAATVAINGRCGKDADDVPLQSLTQHLFLQFTERQLEDQELLPLDGREALRTEMTAKLDGVQKYFHVVVLKKDGCVYDFLQIANQHQEKEPFLDFVRGFQSLG